MRPKALDLFCGAGGASMGLHRAGFDVTGIDIKPQKRYPFRFIQGDALQPPVRLEGFDLVWASPPCQAFTTAARKVGIERHPDHIQATRAMLTGRAALWCIENVPGAPLVNATVLDGGMFGLRTLRRRHFETNFAVMAPPRSRSFGPTTRDDAVTVTGHPWKTKQEWRKHPRTNRLYRGRSGTAEEWAEAMGIDWMHPIEMAQAIPPAYAEHIGRYAMMALGVEVD